FLELALRQTEPPPDAIKALRRQFFAAGGDETTLPFPIDAMFHQLVRSYAKHLHAEACRNGSPLSNLVNATRGEHILESLQALAPVVADTNDTVHRLEDTAGRIERKVDTLRPAELPPPPAPSPLDTALHDFVGRTDDCRGLEEALRTEQGAALWGLRGMGGIGKTTLAVRVAHLVKDVFPESVVQIPLFGTARPADTQQPLTPAQAASKAIRHFEPAAQLPPDDDSVLAAYRQFFADKKALVLLDNAKDAAQVKDLVLDPPAAVLITSRTCIQIDGLREHEVTLFQTDDAADLLRSAAGARTLSDEDVAAIDGFCRGLPLALRVAGSFLGRYRDWEVGKYVAALRAQRKKLVDPGQNRDVEATLALSVIQLIHDNPEAAAHWQELAVFPGDFDAAAAQAVCVFSDDAAAADFLGDVCGLSLLARDEATGRYGVHDLLRPIAQRAFDYAPNHPQQGGQAERLEAAAQRHAEHYCDLLSRADDLFLEGHEHVLEGLTLADLEWDNILAGQAWAAEHASADTEAARLASAYPNAGAYVINLRLTPWEQIAWLETALDGARKLGDRSAEGGHLGNLGLAYAALGDARKAIEYYEQHREIAREIGDRRGEGASLGNLGLAYADLGDARKAIEFYEQHLEIAREIGDRRGEGAVLGNLGVAYADLGDARKAIEYYEQDLVIAREIGDRRGEANA
ncbi:MAG: tetratricopeptide repeat protein, partial [Bradyrhizobium sp.]|nr:tetratricopeptide repeat protein [Bradyrhizobium sp.]